MNKKVKPNNGENIRINFIAAYVKWLFRDGLPLGWGK